MTIPVFYTSDDIVEVGPEWYDTLKENAYTAMKKRSRLCLHHSAEDALHEMIIVFHHEALIPPHRHHGKTESFHIIFGELDVLLFDDDGRPTRIISMGDYASGKPHVYRMNAPIWHSVIIRSEYAAIHEVTNGPFRVEDADYASWAPEPDAALREFLAEAANSLQMEP